MDSNENGQTILPLGTFCMAAEMLKTHGLRQASYPFDWIFCSVASVTAILRDDFAQFLNAEHLVPTRDDHGGPRCMHALYDGLNPERPTFAHRDPTRPEDRAYYERCIARFRSAVESSATLFMIEEFGEIEGAFERLCDALARYPACQLIAVRHECGDRALSAVREQGRHRLVHYRASAVMAGVRLAEPPDETYLLEALFEPCAPRPAPAPDHQARPATPARPWSVLFPRLFVPRASKAKTRS